MDPLPIDVDEVEKTLTAEGIDPAALDHLAQFGEIMVNEVTARTSAIESKALAALGWATALLGFLLLAGNDEKLGSLNGVGVVTSGVLALVAARCAFDTLRVRNVDWPSARDWFCLELVAQPTRLRAYHLMSLLETHQKHSHHATTKATSLAKAQRWLLLAALVTLLTIVASLLPAGTVALLNRVGHSAR